MQNNVKLTNIRVDDLSVRLETLVKRHEKHHPEKNFVEQAVVVRVARRASLVQVCI